MIKRNSPALRALFVCVALVLASTSAFASHLRGTSISWSPTSTAGQVQFTIQYSQRTSFGGCNTTPCAVGSTLLVPLNFGDGQTGTITATISSINSAEDWFSSTGTLLHTYAGAGPYTASYNVCCRVSTIVSGHDVTMQMETTVSPRAVPANNSPVVSMPAIITLPLQNTTGFFISASDLNHDTLSYRLSTSSEMYAAAPFTCAAQQPPGLSVNSATGQVTWDTTQIVNAGCSFAAPKAGDLWTVQFMIEDHDALNNVKSKVPLDVILTFVTSSEAPPTLVLSNPGPINAQVGTPITFTATGNDAAVNSRVTLNATGLPLGATVTNLNSALIPPVSSVFSWTPAPGQEGSYVITYTATNDTFEQVIASVTIYVQNIQPPTLTCSATLTGQYGVPLSIGLKLFDPQADALTVIWTVDGSPVRTDNIPASNAISMDSLSETFTTLGVHDVSASATNTDGKTSACGTAVTITQANQTITFPKPTGTGYGLPNVVLGATATSGLPVSYSATGACTVVNGTVHVTGAGLCSLTANQAGNANYTAAAPVTVSFTTAPAALTVTANNASRAYGAANPVFTDSFLGFVNGDTSASLSGAAANSTTASISSPAGNYPITVTAGTLASANYTFTFVNGTLSISTLAQTITFNPPATTTFGSGTILLSAVGGASGNPVTFFVSGPATLSGNILTITGAGNVVVTANQAGNANYSAAPPVSRTIVVLKAAQVINFPTPVPVFGVSTIPLLATGGASGNPVTYTVSGPATLNGNILTVTGSGLLTVTANQAGNANYLAAAPVSHTFNSTISATVVLSADSTSFSYPNSTNLRACVHLLKGALATGTVSFFDGGTLLTTQKLGGDGCVAWYIAPVLNAGSHTITAFYTDSVNTNVPSKPVVITVSRGTTVAEVSCWQLGQFAYGANFYCDANPDSGPNSGYFTFSLDGGAPVQVVMNAGQHSLYTVSRPTVGAHTMLITYPAQGNYSAYTLPLQTFNVTDAPVNVALTPSTWYTTVGHGISFNVALTSWSAGVPSSIGTVSFYDGAKLLGKVSVNASGQANLPAVLFTVGTHTITANYSGNPTQYAAASSTVTIQIGN